MCRAIQTFGLPITNPLGTFNLKFLLIVFHSFVSFKLVRFSCFPPLFCQCYKIYNVASLVLLNAIINEFPFMHPSFGVLALVLCLSQELLAKRFLGSFLVFMDTEDRILYINDEGVIPEALSRLKTPVHLSEINGAFVSFFIAV